MSQEPGQLQCRHQRLREGPSVASGLAADLPADAAEADLAGCDQYVFVLMPEMKLQPDVVSFSAAISSCEKMGRWQQALELFSQLTGKPHGTCFANDFSFNAVISSCEKAGRWQEALHLMSLMVQSTVRRCSDIITYFLAISSCERGGRLQQALNLFEVGLCIVVRSACDAWQPVLTGAVFNLVNGDQHEVERESHFLYFLCSWTFGCSGRLPLARSVILGLMLAALVQGLARVLGDGIKKAMRERQNTELRIAMFEHLLSQDQALYDTLRQRDLVQKVELRAMSEVTEWVWGMAADTVKLATQLVFLFAISPLMTLAYTVLLPLVEQSIRRYFGQSFRAQTRRENGLQSMSSSVVHEAVYMIRTVKCFSREDKHVALVSLAASGMAKADQPENLKWKRSLKHGLGQLLPEITQRCVCARSQLIGTEQVRKQMWQHLESKGLTGKRLAVFSTHDADDIAFQICKDLGTISEQSHVDVVVEWIADTKRLEPMQKRLRGDFSQDLLHFQMLHEKQVSCQSASSVASNVVISVREKLSALPVRRRNRVEGEAGARAQHENEQKSLGSSTRS
eukprot:s288_g30.t2